MLFVFFTFRALVLCLSCAVFFVGSLPLAALRVLYLSCSSSWLVLCLSCSVGSLPFVLFVFFAFRAALLCFSFCVLCRWSRLSCSRPLCLRFVFFLSCDSSLPFARFRFFAFRTLPVLCLRFRSFAFRTLSVLLCLSHTLSVLCLSYAFGSLRFARFRFFTFRTLSGFLPFAELEYFEVTCFFVTEARIRADPGSRVYWTRHPALTRDPGPGIREFRVRLGSRVRGGGPGNVMAADPGSGTPDPEFVMARTRDSGTPDPEFVMAKNERTRDPGSGSPQSKPQYRRNEIVI